MATLEILRSMLYFVIGLVLGASFPAVPLYLTHYVRRSKRGWTLIPRVVLRLVLALVALFLLWALAGWLFDPEVFEPASDNHYAALGFGAIAGFLAGVVIFLKGVRSAARAGRDRTETV